MTVLKDDYVYVCSSGLGVSKFKVVDIHSNGSLVGIDQDGFKMTFSSRFPPIFHKTEREAIISAFKKEILDLNDLRTTYEKKLRGIQRKMDDLKENFSYLIDENPEDFI